MPCGRNSDAVDCPTCLALVYFQKAPGCLEFNIQHSAQIECDTAPRLHLGDISAFHEMRKERGALKQPPVEAGHVHARPEGDGGPGSIEESLVLHRVGIVK